MTGIPDWAGFFDKELDPFPLVVILRGLTPEDAVSAARRAWAAGLRLVEVTIENDAGLPALEAVVEAADEYLTVGAGTVTTPHRLSQALERGARFGVAPGLDSDTVLAAGQHGIPFLRGVATPSEAGQALQLGVTTVKAFPAVTLGPDWIRALAGPLPELRFIPTGGVKADNARDYLDAGALAVGVSSSITASDLDELVRELR